MSQPRSLAFLAKICISATILLGGAYVTINNIMPVVKEMRNPTPANAPIKKDAPATVQMLQKTRQVVAKNDANVGYLNTLINEAEGKTPPEIPPLPPKPKPVYDKPRMEPLTDLHALQASINELHISGVVGGPSPRIIMGGMLIKPGGVLDSKRGLIFVRVDEANRLILFANKDNVIIPRPY
jgi:hypothetical protein